MKKLLPILLAITLIISISGCSGSTAGSSASSSGGVGADASASETASTNSANTRVFRLATDFAADYPTSIALQGFVDDVFDKSEGRIKIDIYDNSQLGDESAYLEQLTFGAIDFCKISVAPLANIVPDYQVFAMPYIFKGQAEMWKVLESDFGSMMLDKLRDANMEGIGFMDNGSRCFFSKTPINSVEDMKNMKVRVQSSDLMMALCDSLGCNSISVSGSEVYSALQTGVVDGAENNVNIYYSYSWYEVAPYLILDNHNTMPEMVVASATVWDSIDAADQQIIRDAMATCTIKQRELWNNGVEESMKKLIEGGVTIYDPDDTTREAFRTAVQPVYDQYGANLSELIAAIEAAAAL
ncbi:TRAP transporter substrate-binding protein [Anaerotruncus rubiinfantis]|uniref:TRAP transporter substrate-binding protein n=1 Tax=Anaerotruncus rubiinfantis TaxID=1720200 RepID=UPI0008327245|nr:TRAP transporter substrate-binding protein [Anaerotruncus rubiinfantis]